MSFPQNLDSQSTCHTAVCSSLIHGTDSATSGPTHPRAPRSGCTGASCRVPPAPRSVCVHPAPARRTWSSQFLGVLQVTLKISSGKHFPTRSIQPSCRRHVANITTARAVSRACARAKRASWWRRMRLVGEPWPKPQASQRRAHRGRVRPALKPAPRGIGAGDPLPLHVMLGQNDGQT